MTVFGIGFIAVRAVLGSLPDKIGGYRVALWSLIVEALGQALLWVAPDELLALGGALVTGLGCALVFPALGVEALKRVLPANRGSAMGAFVAFPDIAYGFAGPAAGFIAGLFGYAAVYLLGAASAVLGAVLVVTTRTRKSWCSTFPPAESRRIQRRIAMSQFLFPAPQPALASWPANCSSSSKWCFMPVTLRGPLTQNVLCPVPKPSSRATSIPSPARKKSPRGSTHSAASMP